MRAPRVLLPLLLPFFALLPVASLFGGCADDEPAAPRSVSNDAGGTACIPGTRGCTCSLTDGCDPGLLCISRRCLDTEGTRNEPEPNVRPRYRPPSVVPEPEDASLPLSDSGTTSSDGG